jgi:hypothetical protein
MENPIWKITKANRAEGVVKVIELPSNKHKALSLSTSTAKK